MLQIFPNCLISNQVSAMSNEKGAGFTSEIYKGLPCSQALAPRTPNVSKHVEMLLQDRQASPRVLGQDRPTDPGKIPALSEDSRGLWKWSALSNKRLQRESHMLNSENIFKSPAPERIGLNCFTKSRTATFVSGNVETHVHSSTPRHIAHF